MFDFLKGKKYKKEVEELKARLEDFKLTKEELKYLDVKKELYSLEKDKSRLIDEVSDLKKEIEELKGTLLALNDEQEIQSYGFYEPKYGLESSQAYKIRLDNVRGEQKDLVRRKNATNHSTDYLVEGDKKKGKEFILDTVKLSLRAFNNECDNIISNVKFNNVEKSVARINKIFN